MTRLPQIAGAFAVLWGLRWLSYGLTLGPNVVAVAVALLWLVAGVALLAKRPGALPLLLVLALVALEMTVRSRVDLYGLQLLALTCLGLLTCRPGVELAWWCRTLATSVYLFAAVTKLNPSWLAGVGIERLIETRPQLAFLPGPIPTRLAVAAAVVTIVMELAIPALLWSSRTRRAGALAGIGMHVALCLTAIDSFNGFGNLVLLNFGLVALYPAFWVDLRPAASVPVAGPAPPVDARPQAPASADSRISRSSQV